MVRYSPLIILRYSPDELKALALHYGSYEAAALRIGISKTSMMSAANADVKGVDYNLSEAATDKIYNHLKRLGQKNKSDIKQWEKLLDSMQGHVNVKRAFMRGEYGDRKWAQDLYFRKNYRRTLKKRIFWTKIMGKMYDKYGWKRGQFSR